MSKMENINSMVDYLMQGDYLHFNRNLMKQIGINATLVLGEFVQRVQYLATTNELEKDGSFCCPADDLEDLTTLKYKSQTTAIKVLEEKDFVKVLKKTGNLRYILVKTENVIHFLKELHGINSRISEREILHEGKTQSQQVLNNPSEVKFNVKKEEEIITVQFNNKVYKYDRDINYKEKYDYINNKYMNNNNFSSSNTNKTILYNREMPRGRNDIREKQVVEMEHKCRVQLMIFLKEKGFNEYMINETVKQFLAKGLTKFSYKNLTDAYQNMIDYNNRIKKVGMPPIFLANGVAMRIPQQRIVKKSQPHFKIAPEVPFYNWLEA